MESAGKTQLHQIHKQTAELTDFSGFEMPLFYKGIVPEHLAVRNKVGVFDISHMGRVIVTGSDAEHFLNYVITNDLSRLSPNGALYSVICNEKGGILDDFVIYRIEPQEFLLVPNAGNRRKDCDWLALKAADFNVKIEEVSDSVAMLAVQGPNAARVLQEISTGDLRAMERFKCAKARMANTEVLIARTGYTGEDGYEIFIWNASLSKPDNAIKIWNAILEIGKPLGIEPCGLGARDTLRLEAGLCLYGNDIDENTTPFEAGLGFVVKLQKDCFVGKDALQKQKIEGVKRKRVGIVMVDEGIPRQGFEIFNDKNEKIGRLGSGTYSPLLRLGVGMGYIDPSRVQEQTGICIGIRDKYPRAKIATFPLYDTEKYGYKRKNAI